LLMFGLIVKCLKRLETAATFTAPVANVITSIFVAVAGRVPQLTIMGTI
jgi:hypothetical protein